MSAALGIEARPIEGMGQGLDHPAGRCMRQLGVAVQGDDEANVGEPLRVSHVDQWRSVSGRVPSIRRFNSSSLPRFRSQPMNFCSDSHQRRSR